MAFDAAGAFSAQRGCPQEQSGAGYALDLMTPEFDGAMVNIGQHAHDACVTLAIDWYAVDPVDQGCRISRRATFSETDNMKRMHLNRRAN